MKKGAQLSLIHCFLLYMCAIEETMCEREKREKERERKKRNEERGEEEGGEREKGAFHDGCLSVLRSVRIYAVLRLKEKTCVCDIA